MSDNPITPDTVGIAARASNDAVAEKRAVATTENPSLVPHMVRQPTEEDFKDVLKPEGDSRNIFGGDSSDSVLASDDSVGGTN